MAVFTGTAQGARFEEGGTYRLNVVVGQDRFKCLCPPFVNPADGDYVLIEVDDAQRAWVTASLGLATGDVSTDKTYVHTQSAPATVWTLNHNLGKYPAVQVLDSGNDEVDGGEVHHVDSSNLTITFGGPFAGKAILN